MKAHSTWGSPEVREERHDRRRKNAPRWLILGLALNLLLLTGFSVVMIRQQALNGAQAQRNNVLLHDEHQLLKEHTQLLQKYERAADGIDWAAAALGYDIGLICAHDQIPACKLLTKPVPDQ